MSKGDAKVGIWLPTVRTGTGADMFTIRLSEALQSRGVLAEIAWLPHRAEYTPWLVNALKPPPWASVVHINTWLHPRFYAGKGLPILATCHGCVHDPALEPYKTKAQSAYHRYWVRSMEKRSVAVADVVTAVSYYTGSKVTSAFGRKDIHIIPNWLPNDAFSARSVTKPGDPFRLLYVGNWSPRKGSDLLPIIMKRLGEEFELQYTGAAPRNTPTPTNMLSLGWTSQPSEVRQWMREADALLFPSRMEGLPLAVLEAMACGLPIIASDASSLPELVTHGEDGLLCQTDDVDAFVAAARWMKDHPAEWEQMSSAAYSRAKASHCESAALDSYLALYNSLHQMQHGHASNTT